MKRFIHSLLTWLIVVLFLATVVDLSILVVICTDCVIGKGNSLETCHDALLPSAYGNLASSLGYVLVEVDLLCVVCLCLLEGRIRIGRPTLRKPYSYEVVMWLVTLVLLIDTWMDAGSILTLWVLSALETLSDITTNLVTTLLNPLNLGRKEGLPGGPAPPSGWNLHFGLAIPCLFNAFLFYYDTTVAALSVINNETVGTDMERRVLLLLCGACVVPRLPGPLLLQQDLFPRAEHPNARLREGFERRNRLGGPPSWPHQALYSGMVIAGGGNALISPKG